MPMSKTQRLIFGVIMSYSMAVGMEIYNVAIKLGITQMQGGFSAMTYMVLWEALKEAAYMGVFVFLFSNLWGNRLGAQFAARVCDPKKDNPFFCRLMRQAGTVAIMCPTMSLVATILFSLILGGVPVTELPVKWLGTLMKNFPMAFFWNMFAAAPFTNWVCGKLFR